MDFHTDAPSAEPIASHDGVALSLDSLSTAVFDPYCPAARAPKAVEIPREECASEEAEPPDPTDPFGASSVHRQKALRISTAANHMKRRKSLFIHAPPSAEPAEQEDDAPTDDS